jgi:hypothetical protein
MLERGCRPAARRPCRPRRGQHLPGGPMGDLGIAHGLVEFAGRDGPAVVEAHPGQRLDADDLAGVETDDRLVVGDDASFGQGVATLRIVWMRRVIEVRRPSLKRT